MFQLDKTFRLVEFQSNSDSFEIRFLIFNIPWSCSGFAEAAEAAESEFYSPRRSCNAESIGATTTDGTNSHLKELFFRQLFSRLQFFPNHIQVKCLRN